MDTETFKAWFGKTPMKRVYWCPRCEDFRLPQRGERTRRCRCGEKLEFLYSEPTMKFWCPHCRGGRARKPLVVLSLGREGKEIGEWVFCLKKAGAYPLPKNHFCFSSFAPGEMMPGEVEPPMPMGRTPEKGNEEERMEPNVGGEAVELIAHYVGYRLDQAALRERELSLLKEAGYFKKAASLRKEWREAIATGDGAKLVALLQERAKLRSERRKITLPLAPARQDIWEGMTFLTKVAFPETLAKAGVEPIRHL